MLVDVSSEVLFTLVPRIRGNMDPSREVGNGRKTSNKTLSFNVKGVVIVALALAVVCMAPDFIAQEAKESIDVPPHSRLLLRAIGTGDQVYGCVNAGWVLKAPDARLLDQQGSVIGRHFAGPTWQLNSGSWVKGKAVAKQVAPDTTGVPWLLLESVDATGRLRAPDGSCSQDEIRKVPYTATYSFYESAQ